MSENCPSTSSAGQSRLPVLQKLLEWLTFLSIWNY